MYEEDFGIGKFILTIIGCVVARIIMKEFGRILLNDDVRNSGYL